MSTHLNDDEQPQHFSKNAQNNNSDNEEADDNLNDDGGHNEHGDVTFGGKNKRVSEQDAFAKTMQHMIAITPINRKLYKAVLNKLHSIEVSATTINKINNINSNASSSRPLLTVRTMSPSPTPILNSSNLASPIGQYPTPNPINSDSENTPMYSPIGQYPTTPVPGIDASSPSPSSRVKREKKGKPIVKNKAALIIEEAELKKAGKFVIDLKLSAINTVNAINGVREPSVSQIIQWLRVANEVPPYIAMIAGAILGKLSDNDDINLSIEIYQYWIDSLNTMQAEIDAYKTPKTPLDSPTSPKGSPKPPPISPIGKMYKDIKKENIEAWKAIMRKFEHQLHKTVDVKNHDKWIRYQLREVEGIHPNTLYDIATYRAELSTWQLELLRLLWQLSVREDISKDGGLLVHSTTTSGKTTLTLFMIDYFVKSGHNVICLFPNEMLAMQCAALIQQTTKASISVYTENLAINNPNATVHIIVPGYQPDDFPISDKMMLIIDECHVINEPYYAKYRELVEMLAAAVQTIIALSATLPDVNAFVADMKKLFGTDFKVTGTTTRPVRMRLFDSSGEALHSWARVGVVRGSGLAGPDIDTAIAAISEATSEISEMLNNTIIPRKLMLQNGADIDRIDTSTLDSYEAKMLDILNNTNSNMVVKCFPNKYNNNVTIINLYNVLHRVSKDGSVLVFCEDPDLLFSLLARESNRQLMETVPFWNEILTINREFVARVYKLRTFKYIEALAKLEEANAKGAKGKEKNTNDLVNSTRDDIKRNYENRNNQLTALHALYKDLPIAKLILEQIAIEIDGVSDNYQPWRHLQFGRYSYMELDSVRGLYPGMGESKCRAVTNGLAVLDDFSDLPTRIKILQSMGERHFSTLISGRKTLALGVNVGVRSTVIYDPNDVFLPSELKQMSERSGRKGLDRTGYTTIIRKSAP